MRLPCLSEIKRVEGRRSGTTDGGATKGTTLINTSHSTSLIRTRSNRPRAYRGRLPATSFAVPPELPCLRAHSGCAWMPDGRWTIIMRSLGTVAA